jgi:hypothetical protein
MDPLEFQDRNWGVGMRRIISFIVAIGVFGGGVWIAFQQLFISTEIKFLWVYSAGFFAFIGAYWLWADFVSPLVKGKTTSKQ